MPSATASASIPAAFSPAAGSALAELGTLAVHGANSMAGYGREAFGPEWADVDGNSCDTRDDVLRRDLTNVVIKAGTGGCAVSSGDLADPYTGLRIRYVRGGASEVDIDHVVSLGDAWQTGAQALSTGQRTALANDPLNLLAVGSAVNREKGDADAAVFLPPNTAYRCPYVARQVAVKARYSLWVTLAEKTAMTGVLATCPAQPLPAGGVPPAPAPATSAAPPPSPPAPAPPTAAGLDPRFPTCTAAKAAGYGPYLRGVDPEYSWYQDRDGDGTACE